MTNNSTHSLVPEPTYKVVFNYQSQFLTREDWTALVTLCLAPLLGHLVAGVPKVIYLHNIMPRWHDSIILYNPISIIWRYCAITERSMCSVRSSLEEVAAINVVYWTKNGWCGSDAEIQQGKSLCVQPAPCARARALSTDTLKTIIVATQGVAAAGALLPGPLEQNVEDLGKVFLPLAFIGLLRLPAAYWLSDNFVIVHLFDTNKIDTPLEDRIHSTARDLLLPGNSLRTRKQPSTHGRHEISVRSRQLCLLAFATRLLYVAFMFFGFGVCMYRIILPIRHAMTSPLTILVMSWSYMFWLIVGTPILILQIFKRETQPLVIPCANSTWYKALTLILILLALGSTTVAALETRKHWPGFYTVEPQSSLNWTCGMTLPGKTQPSSCWTFTHNSWIKC